MARWVRRSGTERMLRAAMRPAGSAVGEETDKSWRSFYRSRGWNRSEGRWLDTGRWRSEDRRLDIVSERCTRATSTPSSRVDRVGCRSDDLLHGTGFRGVLRPAIKRARMVVMDAVKSTTALVSASIVSMPLIKHRCKLVQGSPQRQGVTAA